MHRGNTRFLVSALILAGGAVAALANSTGPQPGHTGAPKVAARTSEPTCAKSGCHLGNPLNQNGVLEVLGVPEQYIPGNSYPITVRLSSTATQNALNRRWGFELTAVRLSDGLGAGSYSSTLLQNPFNGRVYISHNLANIKSGQPSPVEWTFGWIAPATDEGDVAFYAAGNAANGLLTSAGDFIYTGADTSQAGMVPVARTTWGRLKSGVLFE